MIIATFGSTTGWSGKTITFENDQFVLEGHGIIAAADVLDYDRQGHLVWVNDGTRSWGVSKAGAPQVSRAATGSSAPAASAAMAAQVTPVPIGLEGVSRGDWVVIAGAVGVFFGMLFAWTADSSHHYAMGWFPMLAAIAAVVVVVLASGMIPGQRYEMAGRVPLIVVSLGILALLVVLIGMIVVPRQGWLVGSFVALLGTAAVIAGGYLKMREPVAAGPAVAFTAAPTAAKPPRGNSPTAPVVGVAQPISTPSSTAPQADPVQPPVPGSPTVTAADVPTGSIADQVAKLAELHDDGKLTDEEFAALKAKLME